MINLDKFIEAQRELDNHINLEHPKLPGDDRLTKKVMALIVELGELGNEIKEYFKFWSYKKNNMQKAIEEFSDCLHFLLSLAIEANIPVDFEIDYEYEKHSDIPMQFIIVNSAAIRFNSYPSLDSWETLMQEFLILGNSIGFEWDDIEREYFKKNQENHVRQEEKY